MKLYLNSSVKLLSLMLLGIILLSPFKAYSAEFVLMNRIISYDVNAQDPFWCIEPTDDMPSNWLTPDNYYNGQIYTRYEVISVPTNVEFGMEFGIFQWYPSISHHDSLGELCEATRHLQGVGDVAINNSSPASWYQAHGGVDFSKINDIPYMCPIIFSWDPKYPVGKPGESGDPAGVVWANRFNWFPATIRVTVVAVSSGSTFSGWGNYVIDPDLRKPTPTYTIDYINETTNETVPSTDEFSLFSNMYGAVSGTGAKMILTPGQDANFRTKAGGGLHESEVQHFDVPCRPATPTFVLDNVNNRTSTVVSSLYEYSDNSDMSGAVTGTGAYVSIPAGTTKYFRKKATSTSFKSNVQTLNESTVLPIAHEFVIFNGIVDYPNNTDTNGFYYFYYNSDMPVNWKSPDDYYNGKIYMRYEIMDVKTTTQVGLQFGIWQMLPQETGELHETMSKINYLSGAGAIGYTTGSLSSATEFWKLDPNLDFTKMDQTWHFGINPWKVDPYEQQIRQENAGVWSQRNTYWFPMKAYVTVVAVANGYTFSGWSNYLGVKSPTPVYTINYNTSKTNQVVPSTDEYSYSSTMSPAYSGTGAILDVTPGQNVYFRTKAHGVFTASDIQQLVVPAKPVLPDYAVNFNTEQTSQVVASDVEYSTSSDFSTSSYGTNQQIDVTPGQDLYFRKNVTESSFASDIRHLVSPTRPATISASIDYLNETTNEVFASTIEYSANIEMTGAVTCSNAKVVLNPGTDFYFRVKATESSFASFIAALDVPSRPATPTISINYTTETTSSVGTTIEYSVNESFSSSTLGQGTSLTLTPGTDLYFRVKGTASSFKSATQHLDVPSRPTTPTFTINYTNGTTNQVVNENTEYSTQSNFTGAHSGNGQVLLLTPGQNLYFRQKVTSTSFLGSTTQLTVPSSNFLGYTGNDTVYGSFPVYAVLINGAPAFSLDDLFILNGSAQNLHGANTFDVQPLSVGDVEVIIPANTVLPNTFASNKVKVYFAGYSAIDPMNDDAGIKIYPNPSEDGIIYVETEANTPYSIDILSTDGKTLVTIDKNDPESTQINLGELRSGIYLLRICQSDQVIFRKLILE